LQLFHSDGEIKVNIATFSKSVVKIHFKGIFYYFTFASDFKQKTNDMSTNKDILKLQFLTFLIVLISFSGCEKESDKEPQFEIYENHEISACGVDDPLQDIDSTKIIVNYYIYSPNVMREGIEKFISIPSSHDIFINN
jgi:hypothetical protein